MIAPAPTAFDHRVPDPAGHGSEQPIGLVAINSIDFLDRYFDLLDAGRIVVPLRSAADQYRIEACRLTEIAVPAAGGGWFSRRITLPDSDDTAQVSFTSGTEGEPKGVRLTHRNLSSTARRIIDVMRLDSEVREYLGVPVTHSFGLGRVRAVCAAGGSVYVPSGGFDPAELVRMLRNGEVNAISTVPSLWRVVLRDPRIFADVADKVRWIEIGSQAMTAAEKIALRGLFSRARIVQHYGLTEASRTTFLTVSEADVDAMDTVGRPNGDVQVDISASGRIRVRGSHVASEVIIGGRTVRQVDADGWLETSDLGEISNGNLRFTGRADDIINVGGFKVSPDQLEDAIAVRLGLREACCVSKVPDELRGDAVLVSVLESVALQDEVVRQACVEALAGNGIRGDTAVYLQRVPAIPRTESGKARRKELSARFTDMRQPGEPAATAPTARRWFRRLRRTERPDVRAVFERAFPGRHLEEDSTFVSLGGDSLRFVELSLRLESVVGRLPPGWQNLSIRELSAAASGDRHWLHDVDTTVLFRCIGMIAILMGHFDVADIGGATFLLLAVAGYNFARFQLPNVLSTGSVLPILTTVWRIALPTVLALAILEVRHHKFEPEALLLLDNWTPAMDMLYGYWFLELMVQLLLVVALLFAFPASRELAARRPFFFSLAGLLIATVIALVGPYLWNTEHLFNRVPHMLFWLFILGWMLRSAQHNWQRALACALIVALPPLVWQNYLGRYWMQHGLLWVWLGLAMLILVPKVKIPRPLNRIVAVIASASMFIYIVHYSVRGVWVRYGFFDSGLFEVALGVVGGIVAWWLWEAGARALASHFSAGNTALRKDYRPL